MLVAGLSLAFAASALAPLLLLLLSSLALDLLFFGGMAFFLRRWLFLMVLAKCECECERV